MNVIEITKLTKYYGNNLGISEVDLSIKEGEIFGFIGPNGAGKSTTIRTILNFIFPTSGTATIFGKDCVKNSRDIKKDVGYIPGEVNYYSNMRVKDLLNYASSFYDNVDTERVKRLCDTFEVELNKKVNELSLGNKKKVSIVQALIAKPKLIILDEPTNGLDPLMQSRLFETLTDENKNGTTIFLSSHNLNDVQRFCHRVAIIREGKIITIKNVDELMSSNIRLIKLKSSGDINAIMNELSIEKFDIVNDYTSFFYNGSLDVLIKKLSFYDINDLLIHEPSLEDIFMDFYKKEEK